MLPMPMPVAEKSLGDLRRKLDKKWLFFYLPSEARSMIQGLDLKHGPYGP